MFKSQLKSVGLRQNPGYRQKTHKTVPTYEEEAQNGGGLGPSDRRGGGEQKLISRKGVGGGVDNEPQVQHIRAETRNHSSGKLGQTERGDVEMDSRENRKCKNTRVPHFQTAYFWGGGLPIYQNLS